MGASNHPDLAFAKAAPRRRIQNRADRVEACVKRRVRALCVARDGRCRLQGRLGGCEGPSEWAHLGAYRRWRTRGCAPELRHDRRWTLMLCRRHHQLYDAYRLMIAVPTAAGADGRLVFAIGHQRHEEGP